MICDIFVYNIYTFIFIKLIDNNEKNIFFNSSKGGKNSKNEFVGEDLSFEFEKPCEIAKSVTEKDLKCTGKRFEEATELNKNICMEGKFSFHTNIAISRYSGVMFSNIDYQNMIKSSKTFFENNFLIFSGMYGIVKPKDKIGNYKLPTGRVDLYKFWWDKIPDEIIKQKPDFIVNLLPINYAKLIGLGTNCNRHKKKLEKIINSGIKIININFLKPDLKKISHGVKKIKGEWIKNICEKNITDYKDFGGEIIENGNIIDMNIVINK